MSIFLGQMVILVYLSLINYTSLDKRVVTLDISGMVAGNFSAFWAFGRRGGGIGADGRSAACEK